MRGRHQQWWWMEIAIDAPLTFANARSQGFNQGFNKIKNTTLMETKECEDKGITFMDLAIHFK